MRRRYVRLAIFAAGLGFVAILAGIGADRMILRNVATGPPQRLAAAMGGLFTGGIVLLLGIIAGSRQRGAE